MIILYFENAIDMGAFVFNQNIRDLKRKELGLKIFYNWKCW